MLGVVGVVVAQRALDLPVWTEPIAALLFCATWWVLCWRDLRMVPLNLLVRRGRSEVGG